MNVKKDQQLIRQETLTRERRGNVNGIICGGSEKEEEMSAPRTCRKRQGDRRQKSDASCEFSGGCPPRKDVER